MMTASQLMHPDLSLHVRHVYLLAARAAFPENPTFVCLSCALSASDDVDN
jgi:hypothetical protein